MLFGFTKRWLPGGLWWKLWCLGCSAWCGNGVVFIEDSGCNCSAPCGQSDTALWYLFCILLRPKIMSAVVLGVHGDQAANPLAMEVSYGHTGHMGHMPLIALISSCAGNISSAVGPYASLRYDGARWSRCNIAFFWVGTIRSKFNSATNKVTS